MRRWLVAACGLASACGGGGEAIHAAAAERTDSLPSPTTPMRVVAVDTLARGLVVPWGLVTAPDGRLFVTERPGRIRVIGPRGLEPEPWATLSVFSDYLDWGPESGLMGIALAPDFTTTGHVYVLATAWRTRGDSSGAVGTRFYRRIIGAISPREALRVENRVIRFTERAGRGTDPQLILAGIPANHYHAGGAIAFGPDGNLYLSAGDAITTALPRDPSVAAGKILRVQADGSVPADNPFPGEPAWAMGFRNPQAFGWLADGTMIATEHGPTGMTHEGRRTGHDELNVVRRGGDHGWPDAIGWQRSDSSTLPLWTWEQAVAPAGLALVDGADGAAELFVGELQGGVERISIARTDAGWRATARERAPLPSVGRVRTVLAGADGALYITTSNRDYRGRPGPADDLVLRVQWDSGPPSTPGGGAARVR